MKQLKQYWMKLAVYLLLSAGFVSAMAMTLAKKKQPVAGTAAENTTTAAVAKTAAEKQREQESKAAFLEAYKVFMSPRCMNCHPSGDVPLQGDDSHLHTQGVKRGPDGKGLYALKCSNCHQPQHVPGEHMPPGAAHWQLPPASRKMVFQGKTATQLAMHFKDNNFTGFKNWTTDLIHHVETEPLVLNSWTYGTRPPLTHAEFVAKVKEWIEKGAVVP